MRARAVVLVSLLAAAVSGGCTHAGAGAQPAGPGRPAVLVHVTRGKADLHSASMGLALARSALEQGQQVVVFLNVEAAAFADRALGEDVRFADFPPIAHLLKEIVARGGRVFVCRHCASVMKLTPEHVAPGIMLSAHADVLKALPPGVVSFSY